ncbi:MAG TPA: beta-glucosidase BglX [Chitinophagaceae bacterium]|nr:beta-glucosidase BglX [Chitinophagaceae bacterium]
MRKRNLFLLCALMVMTQIQAQQKKATPRSVFVSNLMSRMTLDEKIGQLNLATAGTIRTGEATSSDIGKKIQEGKVGGILNLDSAWRIREVQEVAVTKSRMKIPLIFGMDVIHGYRTTFPIPLALASSWDMSLIEKSARIAAQEASADGICWTYSPMVDIARDPRWGRIAEGSGEDVYLGSRAAEAYVKGYQGDDLAKNNTILSCVKHFALYGAAEAGRDYNTTDMSLNRMYNEYLPPYKAAFDAGSGSAMSSFNDINGVPATANRWLMTDLLRKQWGFKGFVVTDFTAIDELVPHGLGDKQTVAARALNAGIDMDMVGESFLTTLKKSLKEGKITEAEINMACRRILEAKYDLGLFQDPYKYCDTNRATTELCTPENLKAARDVAAQTFVLLKNQNQLLPLKKEMNIALVGPLANSRYDMVGTWAVGADHKKSVTVLQGFQNALAGKANLQYAKGCNLVDDKKLDSWITWGTSSIDSVKSPEQLKEEALALAQKSDVVVAVMGEGAEMTGESSSRSDISLPWNQQALLKELIKTGRPVVLVLFTGRPLTINWEKENIPAILNVWFGGTEAGNAVADVVFGKVNPSGKLPVTFPQNVGQIPLYYNHKNTGRPVDEGKWFQKYRSNYLDVTNDPLYPFGYGLSYTSFSYGDITLSSTQLKGNQSLKVNVTVKNTGNYDGAEVVQLYIRDVVGSITRPVQELKGFQKLFLRAGETKTISFNITTNDLKFYNEALKYDWEPGEFEIMVGGNSADVKKQKVNWVK